MDIAIYSKDGCPYCDKIKQVFEIKGWDYVEYKLDKDFTKEQFLSEFSPQPTFPRVMIDGTLVGGCTETIQYLKEQTLI